LPSIDPIFGSGIPPGPNSHSTFHSVIRFRLFRSAPHCLTLCDPFATYRRLSHSPASTICRCITVGSDSHRPRALARAHLRRCRAHAALLAVTRGPVSTTSRMMTASLPKHARRLASTRSSGCESPSPQTREEAAVIRRDVGAKRHPRHPAPFSRTHPPVPIGRSPRPRAGRARPKQPALLGGAHFVPAILTSRCCHSDNLSAVCSHSHLPDLCRLRCWTFSMMSRVRVTPLEPQTRS
jgi:hypothetical protein